MSGEREPETNETLQWPQKMQSAGSWGKSSELLLSRSLAVSLAVSVSCGELEKCGSGKKERERWRRGEIRQELARRRSCADAQTGENRIPWGKGEDLFGEAADAFPAVGGSFCFLEENVETERSPGPIET